MPLLSAPPIDIAAVCRHMKRHGRRLLIFTLMIAAALKRQMARAVRVSARDDRQRSEKGVRRAMAKDFYAARRELVRGQRGVMRCYRQLPV